MARIETSPALYQCHATHPTTPTLSQDKQTPAPLSATSLGAKGQTTMKDYTTPLLIP